jgi:hypothetical protein
MDEFEQHELPLCVAKLTETVPDLDVTVAAYAAACMDEKGFPQVRLITSWKGLKGYRLNCLKRNWRLFKKSSKLWSGRNLTPPGLCHEWQNIMNGPGALSAS